MIVADGIYYALALAAGGGVVCYFANPWFAVPLFLLAAFCLYFFRDPERAIPPGPVAVSPADGRVMAVRQESAAQRRVSVFMNIFDVHVNRAPIAGVITEVQYRKGAFLAAQRERSSAANEQNVIRLQGESGCVVFKQIAGLIARRIVCYKKPGDTVAKGERIGLIKFGSRVDVLFGSEWEVVVEPGMRVKAGSSILARRHEFAGAERTAAQELVHA
jgi:phosphatidylserine decarboxylase